MRWFKKQGDTPRLLSLSPLRTDPSPIELIADNAENKRQGIGAPHRSRIDMSPGIWPRHIHSGRNDTHLYNVEESLIVVERKPDRKRTKSQPRYAMPDPSRLRERRNPLLDRVKHTRLSCFKTPPINLNAVEVRDEQPIASSPIASPAVPIPTAVRSLAINTDDTRLAASCLPPRPAPPPCFSDKLKAISEKYLQSSTNRFLARLYKNPHPYVPRESELSASQPAQAAPARKIASRQVSAKLRSFSYGALPGLEDFHKSRNRNPLYQDDDVELLNEDMAQLTCTDDLEQRLGNDGGDDSDSGILVSGESTCSSSSIRLHEGEERLHQHNFGRRRDAKRALSLDRREIFKKMPGVLFPVSAPLDAEEQSFVSVRIQKHFPREDLGIIMTRNVAEKGCRGEYTVAHMVPGSIADMLGTVLVGDEIVHVNGTRVKDTDVSVEKTTASALSRVRLLTRSLHVHIMLLRRCRPIIKVRSAEDPDLIAITIHVENLDCKDKNIVAQLTGIGTPPSHRHFVKNSSQSSRSKMSHHQPRREVPKSEYEAPAEPVEELKATEEAPPCHDVAKSGYEPSTPEPAEEPIANNDAPNAESCTTPLKTPPRSAQAVADNVVRYPARICRRRLAIFSPRDADGNPTIWKKDFNVDSTPRKKVQHDEAGASGMCSTRGNQMFRTPTSSGGSTSSISAAASFMNEIGATPKKRLLHDEAGPSGLCSARRNLMSQHPTSAGDKTPPSASATSLEEEVGPTPKKKVWYANEAGLSERCSARRSLLSQYSSSFGDSSPSVAVPSPKNAMGSSGIMPTTPTPYNESGLMEISVERSLCGVESDFASFNCCTLEVTSHPVIPPYMADFDVESALPSGELETEFKTPQKLSNLYGGSAAQDNGTVIKPRHSANGLGLPSTSSGNGEDVASSNFCTLPRRPQGPSCKFFTIQLEKGPGRKQLGFGIVGGSDSPKGALGIFVSSVIAGQQAFLDGRLKEGDEILAINGISCHNISHVEALKIFKNIKCGPVVLQISRRVNTVIRNTKGRSMDDLVQEEQ